MMTHLMSHVRKVWAAGFLLCALSLVLSPAFAQDRRDDVTQPVGKTETKTTKSFLKTDSKFLSLFQKLLEEPRNSTVQIRCDGKNVALGTVVDEHGWILTKTSVLEGTPTVVLNDGRQFEAKIVGEHEDHDLSLLKIEASKLTPPKWRSSKEVPIGFWTVSVGWGTNPMALGVVSVATRNIKYAKNYKPQTPNNSGYLGVALIQTEKQAVIEQIMPNTSASKAGLKVKDIILSVSGKTVSDGQSLIGLLQKYQPGDKVIIKYKRGDEEAKDLTVTLGKRPQSRGDIQNNMGSKLSLRIDGFPTILQHDGIVLPDQCGGPLVDLEGCVIGINISRAGRTESYAIPAEVVQDILEEMKTGKFALAQNTSVTPKDDTKPSQEPDRPRPQSSQPQSSQPQQAQPAPQQGQPVVPQQSSNPAPSEEGRRS
jgi:serine protease Do